MDNITISATCSCCGKTKEYEMNEIETQTYLDYLTHGRTMGYLQDLFPDVPTWIRSGAIDQYSGGFCICPECCGQ